MPRSSDLGEAWQRGNGAMPFAVAQDLHCQAPAPDPQQWWRLHAWQTSLSMYLAHEDISRFWQRELVYDPTRVRNAAKIALAAAICLFIGLWFRMHSYDWMLITIAVLMLPNVGASLEKAGFRIIGTLIGATIGATLVMLFIQHHLLFTIGYFGFVFVAMYYANGTVSPYAFFIGGLTGMLIASASQTDPTSVVLLASWRGFEIILGVIVLTLVTVYVWPVYAHRELECRLREVSLGAAQLLEQIRRALFEGTRIDDTWRQREIAMSNDIVTSYGLLNYAVLEDVRYKLAQNALSNLTMHFESLVTNLDAARRTCKEGLAVGLHRQAAPELLGVFQALEKRLTDLGDDMRTGLKESRMQPLYSAWQAASDRLNALRKQGRQYDDTVKISSKVQSVLGVLGRIVREVGQMEEALLQMNRVSRQLDSTAMPEEEAGPSKIEQLFTFQPEPFRVAIITASIVTLCFAILQPNVFPLGFSIPLMISIIVVCKTTVLKVTPRTASLIMAGNVLGVVLGLVTLVWVFPHFESFFSMLLWTSFIVFCFAYLAYGSRAYALAGAQPIIPYILMAATAHAPPSSIDTAAWSGVGWLLGTALILVPCAAFWPVRVAPRRKALLIGLWRRMASRLRERQLPHPDLLAPAEVARRRHEVLAQVSQAQDLCIEARLEGEESSERYAELSSLVRLTSGLFFKIEAFEQPLRHYQPQPDEAELQKAFNAYILLLVEGCNELAAAMEAHRPLALPDTESGWQRLKGALEQLSETRRLAPEAMAFETIAPMLSIVEQARQVDEAIHFCGDARRRLRLEAGELERQDTPAQATPATP